MKIFLHSRKPWFNLFSLLSFTIKGWSLNFLEFSRDFFIRFKLSLSGMMIIFTTITSILIILFMWITINLREWATFDFGLFRLFIFMLIRYIFIFCSFIFFFILKNFPLKSESAPPELSKFSHFPFWLFPSLFLVSWLFVIIQNSY